MLFNSLQFVAFFIIVTGLYFLIPHRFRWALLLISSCYFYMAFVPIYILILAFTIVIDYFAGLWIERSHGRSRKAFLICSLIANIGVLAVFKYYNFFVDNINAAGFDFSHLAILLPIGLSFHTFQAMSYTIEVYRGNQKAEKHFGIYALYVMFYPQLVAGPIERPQHILHQFYERHQFDYYRVVDGLKQMAWGMFKKVVIADRFALLTDPVFNAPAEQTPLNLLLGTIFFGIQIYCDFSGYSDIALGAARVMGFELMTNFDRPYSAKTISEFWSRWHISLSSWFRDYLYIPLGGNRVSMSRWYFNLLFVFFISGLWHGANWTFIIWGGLHGVYLIFGILTKNWRDKLKAALGIRGWINDAIQVVTVFLFVNIAWVFFRANSVADALYILGRIPQVFTDYNIGSMSRSAVVFAIVLIFILQVIEYLHAKYDLIKTVGQMRWRWAAYYVLVLAIAYLGVFENRQFIYFQF
jgi:alginate O-acetyltransferase complex protein AlgI